MRNRLTRIHIGLRTVKTTAAIIISMGLVHFYGTTDSKYIFAMLGAMAAMEHTFQESLEAITANYAEAELFSVKRGYPLLKLEGVSAGENDVPFEYTEILFRGDKVKLSFRYNR